PDISEVIIASERLDALVAAVYNLSRSTAKELIEQGRVSVNSVAALRADLVVEEHDTVSVRGSGRFIFEGVLRKTKKDRLRAAVRIYK
ncbi:MAG: RNA-binding protein, partial [Clostridia bacterium]|nr:RNA-binding protein [Clostridia bacterium]